MNILIKLTCLIGLVIAPILGGGHHSENSSIEDVTPVEITIEAVATEAVVEATTLVITSEEVLN